jgi:DNA-binding NarL/FixJ family response regulator
MHQIRVLIADDQEPTRQGLRALLTLSSQIHVVAEAMDGRQAVQMVATHQPDLVLMDMRMPVVDGLEATRRIKAQWPAIKVVALTMYPKYRMEAVAAGVDAFLLKGSPTRVLQDTILAQCPEMRNGTRELQGRNRKREKDR